LGRADPLLVRRGREEGRRPSGQEPHGPADDLRRDFEVLASVARRALKRLCEGAGVQLAPAEREDLAESFHHTERAMDRLTRQMRKEMDDARSAEDGRYLFEPGQEMQHDTSPHEIDLSGRVRRIVLCYSRMLFFQFYPRFT